MKRKQVEKKLIIPFINFYFIYFLIQNLVCKGFSDAGEQMKYIYEDGDFEYELEDTWKKLQPLYKELFTYIRRKLIIRYGSNIVRSEGPLPAHLLGDIWSQDWSNLADFVMPYPHVKNLDVTDDMLRQGFTPIRYKSSFKQIRFKI